MQRPNDPKSPLKDARDCKYAAQIDEVRDEATYSTHYTMFPARTSEAVTPQPEKKSFERGVFIPQKPGSVAMAGLLRPKIPFGEIRGYVLYRSTTDPQWFRRTRIDKNRG